MKLSAPPPPPPPPPEQPTPGDQPPPDPNNANPSANLTPDTLSAPSETPGATLDTPPESTVSSAPPLKPLRWPSWYPGVDSAIAGLVLLLAFGAASFVAYNSDVWIHLAAGKRLLAGEYIPGSDPFSYSAADRAWVNHSWLTDAIAYLLYSDGGKVLVIAKALIISLAFGLLLAIRRSQYSLWPWAVMTGIAVLAAAPQFTLKPAVVSIFFLAVTLFLLFRLPQSASSWRFPTAIAITFWLWANCDEWFFLGPLVLLLVLIGDLIQTKLLNVPDDPASETEEPLGRLPDLSTLAKALGLGVLVCMLTPNHIRIWELPFELIGAKGAGIDIRLRQYLMTPYDPTYVNDPKWGSNANGLAYAVLVGCGAATLGLGVGRLRIAHIALWVGFLLLSLLSIYAIPFFAVVAVPLISSQLNAYSSRVGLKTWGDPKSRFLWLGSSAGRVVSVLGIAILCIMTYPGWTQPDATNPAYARRVAWGVDADPLLVKAAEQLNQWREQEKLTPEMHGIIAGPDLANYIAWFAPQEKVFVNARYNHHRAELADYIQLRKGLGLIADKNERPNIQDANEVMKKTGAEYIGLASHPAEGFFGAPAADATITLYRTWGEWIPWYLDGRATLFGWHPEGQKAKPELTALRADPVLLAFSPNIQRLKEPELQLPEPQLGWEEAFVRPARPAPPSTIESYGWSRYRVGPEYRQQLRTLVTGPLVNSSPANAFAWHRFAMLIAGQYGVFRFPPINPDAGGDVDAMRASALLALRSARLAILENSAHPEPYFALAEALGNANLPLSESERVLGQVIAYRQCLDRLPKPEQYRKGQFNIPASAVAKALAGIYLGPSRSLQFQTSKKLDDSPDVTIHFVGMPVNIPGLSEVLGDMVVIRQDPTTGKPVPMRVPVANPNNPAQRIYLPNERAQIVIAGPTFLPLDVARETLELAIKYAEIDESGDDSEKAKTAKTGRIKEIQSLLEGVKSELVRPIQRYNEVKTRGAKLPDLVAAARMTFQPGQSLEFLAKNDIDIRKEYGAGAPQAALLQVALELVVGRIENADEILRSLSSPENAKTLEQTHLTQWVQLLKYQKAMHAGEYKTAGSLLEKLEGQSIGLEVMVAELARNKLGSNELVFPAFANSLPSFGVGFWPALLSQQVMGARGTVALQARELLLAKMQKDARFFYQRGVLALMEGNIPDAKRRFQQADIKPPAGWALPNVGVTDAGGYLQLIMMAERKAVAP